MHDRYADGDHVGGSLSQDRLTWGGLAVNNQVFAEISDAATFTITCVEDGLLGMAFDELASSKQVKLNCSYRDSMPRFFSSVRCFNECVLSE